VKEESVRMYGFKLEGGGGGGGGYKWVFRHVCGEAKKS